MKQEAHIGMLPQKLDDLLGTDGLVNMTVTGVGDDIVSLRLPRDHRGQIFIGKKKKGPVSRNCPHDFGAICGGATVVALGFNGSGCVDVGDYDCIWKFRL